MIPYHALRVVPRRPQDSGKTLQAMADVLGPPEEFFVDGATAITSAAERLRKHVPALSPWCHNDASDWVGRLTQCWTLGFGHRVVGPTDLPMPPLSDLLAMCEGFPRQVPVSQATFVWRLPELGDDAPDRPKRDIGEVRNYYAKPEPLLACWLDHRRKVHIGGWAVAQPSGRKPPRPSAELVERLAPLGALKDDGLVPSWGPGEEEARKGRVQEAAEAFRLLVGAEVPLPHELSNPGEATDLYPLQRQHKEPGDAVFRPLGYRSLGVGTTGVVAWSRTTSAHHRLEIQIDVGTRARRIIVSLHLVGLGFRIQAAPLYSSWLEQGKYHVNQDDVFVRLVENVATCVAHVDAHLDEVEALLPSTPPWWKLPAKATHSS